MERQTIDIVLGERSYTIVEAPRVRSAPWRRRLAAEVKPLFEQVGEAASMTFATPADLLRLWPVLEAILVDGLDGIFELLLQYAPELEADREYIENHATEKQILAAFQEVVRLADPFGLFSTAMQQIGRKATMTWSS